MLLLVARCASAQEPLSFRTLSLTPPAVSQANRLREVRARWPPGIEIGPTGSLAKAGATPRMLVVADEARTGTVRRERQPQLSEDQLVIVQRGADGRALDWIHVPDPRLVRAEVPGADGRLTGAIVYRADAELLVTLTHLPDAVTLSVYHPRWNGTEFLLDPVGELRLPRAR